MSHKLYSGEVGGGQNYKELWSGEGRNSCLGELVLYGRFSKKKKNTQQPQGICSLFSKRNIAPELLIELDLNSKVAFENLTFLLTVIQHTVGVEIIFIS